MQAGTALPCQLHKVHHPRCHVNEVHHVWPLGDAGQDLAANKVIVCATGHNNVHHLLDAYRKVGGDPGWPVRQKYAPEERVIAAIGWGRIQRRAM
jgi:hypothetical protein